MQALSQFLARHATALMLAGVATGLLAQPLAAMVSPFVLYLSMGAMFLSALRIDPRQLKAWAQRTRLMAAVWVWTLLIVPAVVWLALPWLNLPVYMGVGLLLLAATPPIISVGPYCALLGTDAEMLLTVVLPATVISIVTLPLFAALSGVAGLSPGGMLMNLLWVVGISLGGGFALRVWATPERIEQNASAWTLCMVLLMVFIALGVTHGLTAQITQDPALVLQLLALTALFNLAWQWAGWQVFKRLTVQAAMSVSLISGFRNVAVLLGLVLGHVTPDLQLMLVMAQIQLFVLPSVMKFLYLRMGLTPTP
jgi:BASS family bile acid:Na+ symporter